VSSESKNSNQSEVTASSSLLQLTQQSTVSTNPLDVMFKIAGTSNPLNAMYQQQGSNETSQNTDQSMLSILLTTSKRV